MIYHVKRLFEIQEEDSTGPPLVHSLEYSIQEADQARASGEPLPESHLGRDKKVLCHVKTIYNWLCITHSMMFPVLVTLKLDDNCWDPIYYHP